MFILSQPYISQFLFDTIKKNNFKVLKNKETENLKNYPFLVSDSEAIELLKTNKESKLYTNSEDSIQWIMRNIGGSETAKNIELFKNKILFRNLLKPIYPDFYYKEVSIDELNYIKPNELKFPFILKPAIGFLSFGVYPVKNIEEFNNVRKNLKNDIEKVKGFFPKEVVDTSTFIIEEMIEGEEYAVDVYYSNDSEAVILNIFHHPFLNEKDVSDRIYYTSKEIIKKYLPLFQNLFNKIGELANLKNFLAHVELRGDEKNNIIPIEVNPMRFTGWCITDIAYPAYGINPYEYYMTETKPDWETILKRKDNDLYFFICAATPDNIDKENIKEVDYKSFISDLPETIELREQNYKEKPLFAIVFGKTKDKNDINKILSMDFSKYMKV